MADTDILRIIKTFFLVIGILFIVGAATVVATGLVAERKEAEVNASIEAEMNGPNRVDGHDIRLEAEMEAREEMYARGDAGDDEDRRYTDKELIASVFDTGRKHSRKALIELALGYNGCIPYAQGGRSYDKGFHKYPGGIDNRGKLPELQTGLDSWGYVVWLFRNTNGSAGDEWLSPEAFAGASMEVTESGLEVGDVGMLSEPGSSGNHYGVCVGFLDGIPVFSHCANIPADGYPCGNSRLSYLASSTALYLHGSAPVRFTCFYRPGNSWEEEL